MHLNRVARDILMKGVRGRESAMVAASPLDSPVASTKFTENVISVEMLQGEYEYELGQLRVVFNSKPVQRVEIRRVKR